LRSKIRNIIDTFPDWPIIQQLLGWSKHVLIPGFGEVPLYNVLVFIMKELKRDAISTRANSIAFNFVLAIFPGIIFIFTLIPLMPFSEYYSATIVNSIRGALPDNAANYLIDIITGITSIKRGGLLSLGFLLSTFFAANGMLSLMFGFDKSYDKTFKKRSYLKKNLIALMLTYLLFTMFLVSVIFIIVGDNVINLVLGSNDWDESIFSSGLRWILALVLIYTGITIIYRYGPSMYRKINFWNPGAIMATILSILTSVLFSFFINNFGRYNEIYGSIGALIIVMVWLQFNAFILLIGFELNASIAVNRDLLADKDD
jgi:membrane protein